MARGWLLVGRTLRVSWDAVSLTQLFFCFYQIKKKLKINIMRTNCMYSIKFQEDDHTWLTPVPPRQCL